MHCGRATAPATCDYKYSKRRVQRQMKNEVSHIWLCRAAIHIMFEYFTKAVPFTYLILVSYNYFLLVNTVAVRLRPRRRYQVRLENLHPVFATVSRKAKKGQTYFKIQGTYFEICQTYFKISQTYFPPSENPFENCPENADKNGTFLAPHATMPRKPRQGGHFCGTHRRTRAETAKKLRLC